MLMELGVCNYKLKCFILPLKYINIRDNAKKIIFIINGLNG